jgi:hypothetical protein
VFISLLVMIDDEAVDGGLEIDALAVLDSLGIASACRGVLRHAAEALSSPQTALM